MWAWWTASAVSASSVAAALGSSLKAAELLGEVAALDEFHAEVLLAVVLADLVHRDDPRVVEQRDRLGLVLEPPQFVVACQHAGLDHLEGDGPVEADSAGPCRRRPCRRGPALSESRSRRSSGRWLPRGSSGAGPGRRPAVPVGSVVPVTAPPVRDKTTSVVSSAVRPSRLGAGQRSLARVAGAGGGKVHCGVDVGRAGGVGSHRLLCQATAGQRPTESLAGCSTPQPGHRFELVVIGRLRRARRRPSSISHGGEAWAESSVASDVLSHKPSGRGHPPIRVLAWPGASVLECNHPDMKEWGRGMVSPELRLRFFFRENPLISVDVFNVEGSRNLTWRLQARPAWERENGAVRGFAVWRDACRWTLRVPGTE